jgi:hypothetical protein
MQDPAAHQLMCSQEEEEAQMARNQVLVAQLEEMQRHKKLVGKGGAGWTSVPTAPGQGLGVGARYEAHHMDLECPVELLNTGAFQDQCFWFWK